MNLYYVLKRGTYFVKLLYFQSRDDRFDLFESLELLSVWRTNVDISKLSVMNELNQRFPFVNALFFIQMFYHSAAVTNGNIANGSRTIHVVVFVTGIMVQEVPSTCKL